MTTREDVKLALLELDELVAPEAEQPAANGREPTGRIVHDERGNAKWKWAGETSETSTTLRILDHIDPVDLKVEGSVPERSGRGGAAGFDPGGGYDPYNQGAPKTRAGTPKASGGGKR